MKNHVKVPVSLFKALLVISIFLFFPFPEGWAQSNYSLQAHIIHRFTKYVNWPNEKKADDVVIGIAGDTPLYDELTRFTKNKAAGGRPVVVKKFPASAPNYNCQLLFIIGKPGNYYKIKRMKQAL
jgi:hypothetical protein